MTAVRIISTIALLCYLLLCLLVMRDVRRREIRSFSMFLAAMLIWQVGVTVVSFTSDPTVALWGYRVVIGLGGSFGIFYAQFTRDFLVVRSHRWLMRVGYVFVATVAIWTLLGGPGVITAIYQSPVSSLLLPEFGPIAYLSAAVTYSLSYLQRDPSRSVSQAIDVAPDA